MRGQKYLKNVASLEYDAEKCVGCGLCAIVCPHRVFVMEGKKAAIVDCDLCMECGACSLNCPAGAIKVRSGVGCAAGIITGFFRGTEPTCDCGSGDEKKCC